MDRNTRERHNFLLSLISGLDPKHPYVLPPPGRVGVSSQEEESLWGFMKREERLDAARSSDGILPLQA